MSRPPAILQVLPALRSGGVERGTVEIAEATAASGLRALVASAGGPLADELSVSVRTIYRDVQSLVGLGAPYWEPNARGTIVGLTRNTGRAHLARAALCSVAKPFSAIVARNRPSASLVVNR